MKMELLLIIITQDAYIGLIDFTKDHPIFAGLYDKQQYRKNLFEYRLPKDIENLLGTGLIEKYLEGLLWKS